MKTLTASISVVMCMVAALLFARAVAFKADLTIALTQTLGGMTLVSLFVERLIEVYVSIWREPEEAQLDAMIKLLTSADGKADDNKAEREKAQEELAVFKSKTGLGATAVGLVFGVLIAAVGFRVLGSLLDPPSVKALADWQQKALIGVDTLLTGAVLSGGSDAVHKIFNLYNAFLDASKHRVEH